MPGRKNEQGLLRITFDVADRAMTERLWARLLSKATARLENSPFYARGVSYGDSVRFERAGEHANFVSVTARGGHSTYRVYSFSGLLSPQFRTHWEALERAGCTYEQGTVGLIAVDVPPESEIHSVYRLLERGELDGVWEFEEGHCGHLM